MNWLGRVLLFCFGLKWNECSSVCYPFTLLACVRACLKHSSSIHPVSHADRPNRLNLDVLGGLPPLTATRLISAQTREGGREG
ncbi:hypothetical protein IWZ03DRAFT_368895 [Phyllosticta citriasiana]|uniref:Secreted protein n=1 Tax=Phyllosticta citriasiana TaxID=595635 RepID=A0ABR1KTQ6_9PEZI